MILREKCPVRLLILILMVLTRTLTQCISTNLISSLKYMTHLENKTTMSYCQLSGKRPNRTDNTQKFTRNYDYGPRYWWPAEHSQKLVEIYTVGVILSSIPAGITAEFLGPLPVLLVAIAFSTILNVLRVVASVNWTILLVVEFLMGLDLGLVIPSLMIWIARWAPPNERGIFACATLGRELGTAWIRVETRLLGKLIGWRNTFYLNSLRAFLFGIVLYFLGSGSPENHPYITNNELRYIKQSQKGQVTLTKSIPPYSKILRSTAFWSVNIIDVGFSWAMILQFKSIARYFNEFIGFSSDEVVWLEIIPYSGIVVIAILSAVVGDYIRTNKMYNNKNTIRIGLIFSHILPGVLFIFLPMANCNALIAVVLLFIGVSFIGAATLCVLRTGIDIAPNYAGTIFGILQCSTNIIVENKILSFNKGIIGWTLIFLLGGGCLIGTAVIFLFFGSAGCQWWNKKSQDRYLARRKMDDSPNDKNTSTSPDSKEKARMQPKKVKTSTT